ncbi:hypothetical protein [Aeoliella sp.]|uniref:hypothetical protein n=1 Tax=Aeoliella sp. TaxID=2795800 RepID=UPI003CCBDFD8
MKPTLWIVVPLVAVGCLLATASHAQPYTVYAPPVSTYAAPGACQTCPPPVPPPVVVQPAPRRCCLFRLCDWICGRPAPQPTIAAMPIVPAPQVTCMPTCAPVCAPACGCSPCECGGGCPTGGCSTMPAPSLSSRPIAPSTYAATAPTTYQQYPVQQASYARPTTTYSQPATTYSQPAAGYAAPTSTARPVNYAQPARTYTAPTATVRPINYTQPTTTYAAPTTPVRQVNYTAPAVRQSYSKRAPSPAAVQWGAGR